MSVTPMPAPAHPDPLAPATLGPIRLRNRVMARALLREPDLINRIRAESSKKSLCIHCNLCAASIFTGTRCPLVSTDDRSDVTDENPLGLPV